MRNSLADLSLSFIKNRDIIKSAINLESAYLYPVCAEIFINKHMTADEENIKYCASLLKNETGIFSSFRGISKPVLICTLAASADPQGMLDASLSIYKLLKESFSSSAYLPLMSMTIAQLSEPYSYESAALRARRIYDMMKKRHPLLTSNEDGVFCVLLSYSYKSDDEIINECEQCYNYLKPEFSSGNAVQSLCSVLTHSSGGAEEKCRRVTALYKKLRDKHHKYGTYDELATLGVLALLPADIDKIASDMIEVDTFLSSRPGYGLFGLNKKQRLMHAGMIVSSDYMSADTCDGEMINSAFASGAVSIMIAQQIAMCAAVTACCATAISASAAASS